MLEHDIKEDREFDIIVWGASGFTGQLVVQYFANKYSTDAMIKWTIGGRNRTKLEKVLLENQKPEKYQR